MAGQLDYDGSAFRYFAACMLMLYLIPGGWFAWAAHSAFKKSTGPEAVKVRLQPQPTCIASFSRCLRMAPNELRCGGAGSAAAGPCCLSDRSHGSLTGEARCHVGTASPPSGRRPPPRPRLQRDPPSALAGLILSSLCLRLPRLLCLHLAPSSGSRLGPAPARKTHWFGTCSHPL